MLKVAAWHVQHRGAVFLFASACTLAAAVGLPASAYAGAQIYAPLSASVRAVMQRSVTDQAVPQAVFASPEEEQLWLRDMSIRIERFMPDHVTRQDFLRTVHYEARRAGLDPTLVLGLIEVESGFRKYAVSSAGARGYMQVMPFWLKELGAEDLNLFHLRTNLRFGCTILRHYLDIEQGDLFRALGRYNGSLGRAEYPNLVRTAWRKYDQISSGVSASR